MRRHEREISNISEIESIIADSDVCRVALADTDSPYIVTMNFGYEGGENPCLFFHCAPEGRKIDMIKKNNYVCFEMDCNHELFTGEKGCDWGMNYSSVVGFGYMYIIDDRVERVKGLEHIMAHYGGSGDLTFDEKILSRTTILKLVIKEITGKRK